MDIKRKISEAQGLTPTEQQLGISALAMGEDVRGLPSMPPPPLRR